jgi:hypothetical protein
MITRFPAQKEASPSRDKRSIHRAMNGLGNDEMLVQQAFRAIYFVL